MSNIRSYLKEKERRNAGQQPDFSKQIKKHRMSIFYRTALAVFLIVAIVIVLYIQDRNKVYTQMSQISTVPRQEISCVRDLGLDGKVVSYSNDGISCMDSKGNAIWNQTYEMQNPMIAVCRDVLAVADYNGRNVYVMNSEKKLGEISTNMPVHYICVAANGVVLTVQEDSKVTWINMYDSQGKELVSIPTRMNDTGYPSAVSLSDNGKLVAVSYTYVEAGQLQTRVAFYNFGAVGENQIDHLVAGYNYTDTFIPYIHFINDNTAFAAADNQVILYKGGEVPETHMLRLIDEEIQAVYTSDKYIGLVYFNSDLESTYRLSVMDIQGEEIVSIPFELQSISDAGIIFGEDVITIYNEQKCMVYNISGRLKYSGTFEKAVRTMIPVSGQFRYVLVTADSIDVVELK